MRPIEIRLRNIGPFLDQTINFDNLDNMFLITGNTGAGKTFIFDAMTYALYGELKGNRASHEKDLKSRYASENETEFFVDFTFKVADRIYKVIRTVEFTKPGNKNPTASDVEVYSRQNNGDFECITSGKSKKEKDELIKNLIGLTVSEFSQVILLPQGEFSDFLKQNSSQRSVTLKKLFPVDDYSRLMEKAKEKKEEFEEKIKQIETIINGERKSIEEYGFMFEAAESRISELENDIKELEEEQKANNDLRTKIAAEEADLNHDLEDAKINEANEKQLKLLEEKAEEFASLEKQLALAEKANLFRTSINAKAKASKDVEEYSAKLEESKNQQEKTDELYKSLEAKTGEMKNLKEATIELKAKVDSLEDKISKVDVFMELKKKERLALDEKNAAYENKIELENQIKEITDTLGGVKIEVLLKEQQEKKLRLSDLKNKLEGQKKDALERDKIYKQLKSIDQEIKDLEKKYSETDDLVKRTENTLALLKKQAEEFNLKNQAFGLVKLLQPGCPCPVCGSKEHPAPAENKDLLNPQEQVDAIGRELDLHKKELSEIDTLLQVKLSGKGAMEIQLASFIDIGVSDEINEAFDEAKDDFLHTDENLNDLALKQEKLSVLNDRLVLVKEELSVKENEYVAVNTARVELEKVLGEKPELLQEQYDELSSQYEKNNELYENWSEELNKTKSEKAGIDSSVQELSETLAAMEKTFCSVSEELKVQIENSDFDSEKAVEEAMMELEELTQKRKTCDDYNKNVFSLKEAIKNGRKVRPLFELEEILKALGKDKHSLEMEYNQNHAKLEQIKAEYLTITNSFEKINAKNLEKQELEKQALPYKKLHEDLSGKNGASVPFDTWALGMYFEQVIEFASQRFFEISDHRFEFVLRNLEGKKGNGYKGLDLQVLDHNTPNLTVSDTADLSGGETFEASISLALAITDVVQNNNGGIVLDSLFIDEGFGTLDSDLLDKTMEVLNELSESKMIGLISHVDSLQDSDSGINSQINVHKTANGSYIEMKQ